MIQLDIFTRPSFHNTIKAKDTEVLEQRAETLEKRIYDLLLKSPRGLTRAEACLMMGQQYPEVSIGRALTNLSNDTGKKPGIFRSQEKRKGLYNVDNYVYKANFFANTADENHQNKKY